MRPNVMPDDPAYLPEYRYMPGDYVVVVRPEWRDARVIARYLSPTQLEEYRQQLVCLRCGKRCAGTCVFEDELG